MRLLIINIKNSPWNEFKKDLIKRGFIYDEVNSYKIAFYYIKETSYDMCLIHQSVGDNSSASHLRQWRRQHIKTPVIILSDILNPEIVLENLKNGADDFISLDTEYEEIYARINAVIRRGHGYCTSIINLYPYEIDIDDRSLKINGKRIKLTDFEYIAMEALIINAGKTVSRNHFMYRFYDNPCNKDIKIVSVIICRLRKKLGRHINGHQITTIKNKGYSFLR